MMKPQPPIRLQKFMADCGLGSRRFCETLITAGRVKVDGKIITELGTRIEPGRQHVECNGTVLQIEPPITLLLNKPPKVICTSHVIPTDAPPFSISSKIYPNGSTQLDVLIL